MFVEVTPWVMRVALFVASTYVVLAGLWYARNAATSIRRVVYRLTAYVGVAVGVFQLYLFTFHRIPLDGGMISWASRTKDLAVLVAAVAIQRTIRIREKASAG